METNAGTSKLRHLTSVFAVLLSVFVLADVVSLANLNVESLWYALFALAFWILSAFRETTVTRYAQVTLIAVLGVTVTLFITPDLMGGDLTVMVATMLAYRYGFLRKQPLRRSFYILGPLIVARIGLFFYLDSIRLQTLINQLAIDTAAAPILYYMFEDELIRNRRHRMQLQRLHAENAPFVQFGRNTSGIVHDFKNDLSLFSTFGQLLKVNTGEPVESSLVEKYDKYVDRFRRRIERILFVSRAAHSDDNLEWDMVEAIRATMYVYESNLDFKKLVAFEYDLPDDRILCSGPVFAFLSIVENIIRNSCEAIAGTGLPGTVSVGAKAADDTVVVTVADTGPGLPFCEDCDGVNCFDCASLEEVKTTKADGSGLGLENVRVAARQLGAELRLSNTKGEGVTFQVHIPCVAHVGE